MLAFISMVQIGVGLCIVVIGARARWLENYPASTTGRAAVVASGLAVIVLAAFWLIDDAEAKSGLLVRIWYVATGALVAGALLLFGTYLRRVGAASQEDSHAPIGLSPNVTRVMGYLACATSAIVLIGSFVLAVIPQ